MSEVKIRPCIAFLYKSKTNDETDVSASQTIFQDICCQLSDEHERLYSVPCEFIPMIIERGETRIKCNLCCVMITSGLVKQRLQNVQKHFIKSAAHKSNVVQVAGRRNVSSESIAHMEINDAKKIEYANNLAPGSFSVNEVEGHVACYYCTEDKR